MRIIAFITNFPVVDIIINYLKLTFVAEKLPAMNVLIEVILMEAKMRAEYFY